MPSSTTGQLSKRRDLDRIELRIHPFFGSTRSRPRVCLSGVRTFRHLLHGKFLLDSWGWFFGVWSLLYAIAKGAD